MNGEDALIRTISFCILMGVTYAIEDESLYNCNRAERVGACLRQLRPPLLANVSFTWLLVIPDGL